MVGELIKIYKKIYSVFGSGSYHQPHAIYKKHSIQHLYKYVGLIRAADTRMAGYFIAFARLLRVKSVLKATINSKEFIDSKTNSSRNKRKLEWVSRLIENEKLWDNLFVLTKSIFPALRVLRLADRSEAGMHMLYYFWRMAKKSLEDSKESLNDIKSFIDDGDTGSDVSDGDNDDESDNEFYLETNPKDINVSTLLGNAICNLWNHRKKQIVSGYAIVGWLLCPIEEVHNDMRMNFNGSHMDEAQKVLRKLYWTDTDEEFTQKFNTFREEHREFMKKVGKFDEKTQCGSPLY